MDVSRYAELFRAETREHLTAIDRSLDALRRDGDLAHVAELFRSTHTIKGMAAAMGYAGVEHLAHALESVLDHVRNGLREVDDELVRVLVDGADALAAAVERAVHEATEVAEDATHHAFGSARETTESDGERAAAMAAITTVRVDLRRLDALLDLAGELVIARDRLDRALDAVPELQNRRTARYREHPLAQAVQETTALIATLQDEVLQLRLVPVHQVFDRFPRLVREIARELGKDVAFVTEGRDIELDRSLLESLGDPLVHLLRNAIDHGIESADERLAMGKLPSGQLVLRAERVRDAIVLQVEDDGRGIDRDAVLARAREHGIVDWNTAQLSDEELMRAIAEPGLSTAETVTSISGRGVGIDVVMSRVRSYGGSIAVETERGRGTRFTLTLPTTLAITRALLVSAAGEQFALAASQVVEVHAWEAAPEARLPDSVTLRDAVLPLVPLRARFALDGAPPDAQHLVVVDGGGGRRALLVDEITGHQDIVVKQFQGVRDSSPWFSGATLLGDGRPALIVDLSSLS